MMRKKTKVLAIVAFTAAIAVLPLGAQDYKEDPVFGPPASNLNSATAGIFTGDVDDAFDVHYYSDVEFERGFGFIHGNTYQTQSGNDQFAFDMGYATNLGGLYLGTRYTGNILSKDKTVRRRLVPTWVLDTITQVEDTINYGTDWANTTNQLEALIGIAGMGIKVGFFESLAVSSAPDNHSRIIVDTKDGRLTYTSEIIDYYDTSGWLSPYIGWGMNLGGGDSMTISPFVNFGLNIFLNKAALKTSDFVIFNGAQVSDENVNVSDGRNLGYIQPAVTLGALFEMPKRGNSTIDFGLEYGFSVNAYNNSYDDSGITGSVKGEVTSFSGSYSVVDAINERTEKRDADITYNEKMQMHHAITPSFRLINEPIENFKWGFGVAVPVEIGIGRTDNRRDVFDYRTQTSKNADRTVYEERERTQYFGGGERVSELTIAPTLSLGAAFSVVPNRFSLNAGISAVPVSIANTVTRNSRSNGPREVTYEEHYVDGRLVYQQTTVDSAQAGTDSTRIETAVDSFSANISAGFVFTFNNAMALDFVVGSGFFGNTGFNADLTMVNILFSMKF